MDPLQFQGGKSEDAHEFLTTCRELLWVVGLGESHGVRYATLFVDQSETGGKLIQGFCQLDLLQWLGNSFLVHSKIVLNQGA